MTEEQIERIIDLVEQTGSASWDMAMRQVTVSAVMSVIIGLLCLALIVAIVFIVRLKWKEVTGDRYDKEDRAMLVGIGCLFALLPLLGVLFALEEIVTVIVNPEYAAVEQLADLVGGSS